MAIKGISLNLNDDGDVVSYSEGYEEKVSVFVELRRLWESEDRDMDAINEIIAQVPDPERRETWIGIEELKLLKEIWNSKMED